MHHTHRTITTATTAAALLTLTLATPATAQPTPQPDYPGHTTSHYIPLPQTNDHAHTNGCTQAEADTNGLTILFFGTQEDGDTLRQPGTSPDTTTERTPTTDALDYAHHWAAGFTECATADTTTHLALGVNNKDDGGPTGTHAGTTWATTVQTAQQRSTTPNVTITGAIDAEPGWSTPTWAHDWLHAYTSTTTAPLYAANSADGCPTDGDGPCNNDWTLQDVHTAAGAAHDNVHLIPQIYRTDGIQARQWANIHTHGQHGTLHFAGAMSQHTACDQRTCDGTDNTPEQAWTQLKDALGTDQLGPATDIRWP